MRKNHFKRVPEDTAVIGENLRALRLGAGISQSRAAKIVGVSFQQWQKYEKGSNRLPIEKMLCLKYFFNVPFEAFFEGLDLHEFCKTMHGPEINSQ